MSDKDISVREESSYLVARLSDNDLKATIRDNLSGERLSISDLTTVRVPAAGATLWHVDDVEGSRTLKSIEGIVIYTHLQRAYWSKAYGSQGAAVSPDCWSPDAEIGQGEPGGDCHACPLAEFGSHSTGIGQACKQTRRLFVLTADSLLPTLVVVPPASLGEIRGYLTALAGKALPYTAVETSLSLTSEVSKGGMKYSRVSATAVRRLEGEEAVRAKEYADMIRPLLARTAVVDSVARDARE